MSRLARWGSLFWPPRVSSRCLAGTTLRDPLRPDRSGRAAAPPGSDFRGAGSCSATACHGSILPSAPQFSAVRRNEHTTWISNDAHSRAFQVLLDERSVRIVRNLAADPSSYKPAHEDRRLPGVPHDAPAGE